MQALIENIIPDVVIDVPLLDENDRLAIENRRRMESRGIRCINIMSSPGSGKTTLMEKTLSNLGGALKIGILEGDMTTELDADRLRACGAPVVAITTGRSCHLEADQIAAGLDHFESTGDFETFDRVIIENVGNLICPAAYDLGEHVRVVLVAVTEGEDKPLKYPIMFHGADIVVITKIDLAPYVRCNVDTLSDNIRQVNGTAKILALSSESGNGVDAWIDWLKAC